MRKSLVIVSVILIYLFTFTCKEVIAANTIMEFFPKSGSYNKPFTIDLVIDGHGDKFNAAQSSVSVPSNLKIQDLVLGDCNFSFLKTPSIQNLSFEGVRVASAATKCTVYSITLVPVKKGNATLSISKAAVKRYGDAAEILSSAKDGTYILTGIVKVSENIPQAKNTSQKGLYTLYMKVSSGASTINNASVILENVAKKKKLETNTDGKGIAHFSNLEEGIYDTIVKQGSKKVGETIVNVNGPNKVLNLGINLETQKNNPLMKSNSIINTLSAKPLLLIGILIIGLILGILITVIVIKLLSKRKKKLIRK